MSKWISASIVGLLLAGAFIAGRETTPPAYVKLGSDTTINSATFRNTQIRIQAGAGETVHDIRIEGSSLYFDEALWRTAVYAVLGRPRGPCVTINSDVYWNCEDAPPVLSTK